MNALNERHLQRMRAAGPAVRAAKWPDYQRIDKSKL